ncbi:MAG: SusC/RagA family TonB-linked outer membrane protein [Bacteroidales bacterium]|nr:SusC/RagA family TonB-linked outer membrane protein [Candidatus Liminaster caballi]
MKRYVLFGMTLLMAFSLDAFAQTDNDGSEQAPVRHVTAKKKYETRVVKGCVLDAATGNPVSGAIVKAEGVDGFSTLTDDNGNYELKVPVFTSSIQVSTPDFSLLSLGLASGEKQKTANLLPAAFRADYEKETDYINNHTAQGMKYSNALNIKEDIQSQLGAYAYSISRSGTPGIGNVMFLQGLNSLNSNAQPLVVVDGVILEQQDGREMLHDGFFNDVLTSIVPSDIEDVTVMRNGTALYGARGANGVIIINTHRSHSMATRITARASAGVSLEPKFYNMMDAEQYRGYASELLKGTNTKITDFKFLNPDPDYYYYNQYHNNVDWKDYVYRTAFTQNYGINIEGGDDIAQYDLSVGYTMNEANLECNDMSRLNVRFNTDINLFDKVSVRFDASFSNTTRSLRNDGAPTSYDEGTPTAPSFLAYAKAPFISPYAYGNGKLSSTYFDVTDESYLDEALSSYKNYNYRLGNPAAINVYADGENKNYFENSLLNIAVTPKYDITKNLTLTEHFSYSLVNTNNKLYIPVNGVPSYYVTSVSARRENEVRALASKQNSVQSDTRLAWKYRADAHDFRVFGGVRLNFENYTRNAQLGYNTGSDKTPFMRKELPNAQSHGVSDDWRTMDVYAQGNYNYKGKYFAQVNLTGSGSSRFGKDADGFKFGDVVWGIFPAVQASWVLTNESWLANVNGLDYLRLTAGFDVSGNDGIDNDAARSYFRSQMFLNAVSGISFGGIGNTQIKWETTRRLNAGVDANFLNNRLHVGANFFRGESEDLLSLQALGFMSGLDKNWTNAGSLQNTGYDVTLSGKVINTKNWQWQIGASLGHYKNEIKSLGDGVTGYNTEFAGATIRTEVGSAANLFYGYRTEGVFATTAEAETAGLYILDANGVDKHYFGAGDIKFADVHKDNKIDENDRVVIGDPNPDFYGNIFSTLSWKGFKLDANFTYSVGNDAFNYMRSQLEGGTRFMNQTTALTQRWQAEGQKTSVPKIAFQDPMGNSRFSDRWIEDASYLRLKNITLSYELPLTSQYIQGIQVWIQGNNLFTLTNYLGSDPEFAATSSVIGQGVDLGRVGLSRSFVAGIKINL